MNSFFLSLYGQVEKIGKNKVEERRRCADEWKKHASAADNEIVKDLYDHYQYRLNCLVNGDPKIELEQKD
jgi:hypothetical protein